MRQNNKFKSYFGKPCEVGMNGENCGWNFTALIRRRKLKSKRC